MNNPIMTLVGEFRTLTARLTFYKPGERLLFWHQIRIELEEYEDGSPTETPNMSADITTVAD
jgi:hypothetical protein